MELERSSKGSGRAKKKSNVKKTVPFWERSPLTKNNHFEFGYDGTPFIFRSNPEQTWWVNYGRCERPHFDFRTECILAASEIQKSTEREIWACFSGGIDSQVMVDAFRFARIPFRAAILRFKNDINIHDISWAVIYCETHGVPYEFFDLDIEEFFRSGEMETYAELTRCTSPMLPAQMKVMEEVGRKGGYPVLGSAECYLRKENNEWVMYEREKIASLYRFLMAKEIPGQAGFFQWNPEIMAAFLTDPLILKLVNDKLPTHGSTWFLKSSIYKRYFDIQSRTKYTGFEKIMHLDSEYRSMLEEKYPDSNQQVTIEYNDLMKALEYQPKTKISKVVGRSKERY